MLSAKTAAGLLSEGQMSDYKGAALMLHAFPKAKSLLGDRGYDANWFRQVLADRGIVACIPSKTCRKFAIPHDKVLYRQRHRIENMFGKLKDWRASTPAMTDAPTPLCPPSPLPHPSSSGSDQ